jgi:long-chain acyl-CoA synthetase
MVKAGVLGPAAAAERPWLKAYPPRVDPTIEVVPQPLDVLLDQAVSAYPDHRCMDFLGKSWTYQEVGALVGRAARGLQALGVGRGTRVGLMLPNCPYFVVAYFAVLKAGGTVVNFNPLYAPRELEHQIQDSGTQIVITLDLQALLPKLLPLCGRTALKAIVVGRMADILPFPKSILYPWVKRRDIAGFAGRMGVIGFSDLLADHGRIVPPPIDPIRDVAVLQYSGGTTGVPKGAVLTHAALQVNAEQVVAWHPRARPGEERILGVLPLFHVFGLSAILNYGVRIGAELVLVPRFDLAQVLRAITRRRTTMFAGVPTMYAAIRNHDRLRSYDLTSLDLCISGGAALPLEVKTGFEALTGCTLIEGYGLTESPVVACNPIGGRHKSGSIGLPLPGTAIEVLSLDDRTSLLPAGEIGEICVRGPQVMSGYLTAAGAAADGLNDGRLHTGDVGYLDEEGYCFIVDRLKEVIICSGFNVYPRMVEEAIYHRPAVAEAAVCGVPDEYRRETVKAFVVRRAGSTLSAPELLAFLQDRLSPIEMPKLIEFREELPKSAIGKILKKDLVARAPERIEAA